MKRIISKVIAWVLTLKAVRAFLRYGESRGPMLADSVTYRTLFSVFAGVLLGFSIAGLWLAGNPDAIDALVDAVDNVIPGLVGENGLIQLDALSQPIGFSLTGIISLIGLVGAAIGAIGSLRIAMRTIAGTLSDDLWFGWVMLRNLALAVGIGAGLGASAAATVIGTAGLDIMADVFGLPHGHPLVTWGGRWIVILVTFVLDAAIIAVLFRVLSGVRARARALWSGALLGAVGLTVLQQLSGLFVGGASSNPLLASFASLIALLLWLNLSAQVILIASSYIVTGVEEDEDRIRARYGAETFAQRRVRRAEDAVAVASAELRTAREAEADERAQQAEEAHKAEAEERTPQAEEAPEVERGARPDAAPEARRRADVSAPVSPVRKDEPDD
ncbi:YihY/virulence factor BrkB family protein [Microbacterium invictum]|uniref:Membrane protein n=1 Tax=Microbacterium invictum TaxID=515415 RepID=A0AA40SNE1_9MICO|nr:MULTISPECIES: YihY/virulence factor BrkB family protein [Microbacterium]MBB4139417.1 membrane protein [Microbacterium invictum]